MAITYTALTSVTGATANAAASSLMDAIKTAIGANAAWTLQEDVTLGTGNNRWLCYLNPATASGLPNDYYVLFVYNGTTGVSIYLGETYSTSTHTLTHAAPMFNSGAVTLDANGHQPTASTVYPNGSTGAVTTTGNITPWGFGIGPATTTIYYQFVVYQDHLYIGTGGTNGLATASVYVGGYTSLMPSGQDPYPIAMFNMLVNGSVNSLAGATTREVPAYYSVSKSAYMMLFPFNWAANYWYEYGRAYYSTAFDRAQNAYPVSTYLIPCYHTYNDQTNINIRGRWTSLVFSSVLPTSMVVGDTVAINGTYWVRVNVPGSYYVFLDTGVASP